MSVRHFVETYYAYELNKYKNCITAPFILSIIVSLILLISWRYVSYILFDSRDLVFPIIMLIITINIAVFNRFSMLVLRMKKRGGAYSFSNILSVTLNAAGLIIFALLIRRDFYAVLFGVLIAHLFTLIPE